MKQILIFIGLKIAELGAASGLFIFTSYVGNTVWPIIWGTETGLLGFWEGGMVGLWLLISTGLIIFICCLSGTLLIRANWRWAKRLLK